MPKSLEDKIKELEYKASIELKQKIYEKNYKIDQKFKKKLDEFSEKVNQLIEREKGIAKNKIIKRMDTKLKNKIRKAKGNKTIKYKKKQHSIAKIKNKYLTTLQKYARLRDSRSDGYLTCISCPNIRHWKGCDGGHYVSRAVNATAFDLHNINAQCKDCNGFKGGNPIGYRKGLIKKIGLKAVELLESKRHRIVPLDREWMLQEIEKYKAINQTLEAQKV